MKILYFVSDFNKNPETFVLRELRELKRHGVQVNLVDVHPFARHSDPILDIPYIYPHSRIGSLFAQSLGKLLIGKSIWNDWSIWKGAGTLIKKKGLLKYLMSGFVADSLISQLKKENDIHIHVHHLFLTTFVAAIVASKLNSHFSMTIHTCSGIFSTAQLKDVLNRAAFIRTISSELKPYYNAFIANENKFHLVTNGVNPDEFVFKPYKSQDGTMRILSIGSLYDKKGFDLGLEACRLLKKSSITFSYTIIGEGPERALLERLIDLYELSGNVQLSGSLPNEQVLDMLRESDVLLVPSRSPLRSSRDGLPTVIIEAMSLGIPVVATNFGGISDIVKHQETGLLVNQEDYKGMASAMVLLWFDDNPRKRVIMNARNLIGMQYNLKKNIQDIINLHNVQGAF